MMGIDRRALFASGAAAALMAAAGVSAAPRRGGRLRTALSADLFDQAVSCTLYENLTEIGADGTLRGALATDWTSEQDARVWYFSLRKDVIFHDETNFDATTVALPFDLSVKDKHLIKISLESPNPNLPYLLAHPGYGQRGADGMGTGIYQLQKLDKGRHFIANRLQEHWKSGRAGWFDSVEFVHFSSEAVRAEALRDGLVDVADIGALDSYADPRDFQLIRSGPVHAFVASQAISLPATVGKVWPLDNLRMSERWSAA